MTERHDTDILIIGCGGAGLFAALHAQQAATRRAVTVAVKGLLGKCGCTRMVQGGYNVALGAGRLGRAPLHGHDRGRQVAAAPGHRLAARARRPSTRVRELENEIGCFFDRNPDGTLHQKAFAGQTFDRTVHKGDLTGIEIINRLMEQVLGASRRAAGGTSRRGLIPARDGSGLAGVLFIDIRTRRVPLGTGEGRAAGDRRRPDDVPLPHAVGRQVDGRARHGAARRPAPARHGDGAVPPDRPARRRGTRA